MPKLSTKVIYFLRYKLEKKKALYKTTHVMLF